MAAGVVGPGTAGDQPVVSKVLVLITRGEDATEISLVGGSPVVRERLIKLVKLLSNITVVREMAKPIEPVYVRITPSGRSTILYLGGGTRNERKDVLKYLARNLATFVAVRRVEREHRNFSEIPGEESYYLDLEKSSGTPGQRGQLVLKVLKRMPELASRSIPRVRVVHREDYPHEIK